MSYVVSRGIHRRRDMARSNRMQSLGFDWGNFATSISQSAATAAAQGLTQRLAAAAKGNPTAGAPVAAASSSGLGSVSPTVWYVAGGGLVLVVVLMLAMRK